MADAYSCAAGVIASRRYAVGELRRIADLLPEVLSELVVVEDERCLLAVPAGHVRAWIRQDRERWATAIRRGKSLRRALAMRRRLEGSHG